jgi:hypothetical protein
LQPKSLSRPTTAVFNRDISSSISLHDTNVRADLSLVEEYNGFLEKELQEVFSYVTLQIAQGNYYN